MERRKRIVMARLTKLGAPDDFDVEFWQRAGAQARFAAAWDAVCDVVR